MDKLIFNNSNWVIYSGGKRGRRGRRSRSKSLKNQEKNKKHNKKWNNLIQNSIEEVGKEALNEFNIRNNKDLLIRLISTANKSSEFVHPDKITSSSGSVLILIFNDFVIKIFKSQPVFNKVMNIISAGKNSDYLVKLYGYVGLDYYYQSTSDIKPFYAIVTEKLQPLISHEYSKLPDSELGEHISIIGLKIDLVSDEKILLKLLLQVGDALAFIHEGNGEQYYEHGDCTLDNIGINNNKFKLFDFNAGSLNSFNTHRDIKTLIDSIKFNIRNKDKSNIVQLLKYIDDSMDELKNGENLVKLILDYYKKNYNKEMTDTDIFDYFNQYII